MNVSKKVWHSAVQKLAFAGRKLVKPAVRFPTSDDTSFSLAWVPGKSRMSSPPTALLEVDAASPALPRTHEKRETRSACSLAPQSAATRAEASQPTGIRAPGPDRRRRTVKGALGFAARDVQ